MLVKSGITGVTSISDIQIQKGIARLLIIKTGTTAVFTTETINVAINDNNGNQSKIMTLNKVKDIATISQFTNGYMMEQAIAGGNFKSAYLLELTDGNALDLSNNTYISLDLGTLQSTATYNIYGLEVPVRTRKYFHYGQTVISGADPQVKTYGLQPSAKALAIKNNSAINLLRLFTVDGGEVSYTDEELQALAREINDTTIKADTQLINDALAQTISGGASGWFWYPVEGFKGFEISTVGGTDLTFILVEEKSL